jgi:flagellar assembly protein FliH
VTHAATDLVVAGTEVAVLWEPPFLTDRAPRPVAVLEEIERCAREEGFAGGHKDGFAQGQAELRRLVATLQGLLDGFTRPLAELDSEMEHVLTRLATSIAGGLIRHVYTADPTQLAALVHEALACVGDGARNAEVRLHPDDLAAVRPLLSEPSSLIADVTLARGDVRVHTENVRIDARLATRIESVLAALQSGTT